MGESTENIRMLVLETLLEYEKGREKLDVIMNTVQENYRYLPKNQRAFYVRLTEGVVEQQILLDYILGFYSTIPVSSMKPAIRNILRMALYQIREMNAVPDRAAVSEAVKLTKKKGFASLAGFVNGVLRSAIREPRRAALPPKHDPARYLPVRYSMPAFLVEEWLERFGPETTEKICASFLTQKPVTVRFRTGRIEEEMRDLQKEGVVVKKAPYLPYAFYLSGFDSLTQLDSFRKGRIIAQDVSSMLCVEAANLNGRSLRILDLCASPGGKSLLAADLAGSGSQVLARDVSGEKIERMAENIRRLGVRNIQTQIHDARVFDPSLEKTMDVVFADLPCSGYGVIGRKPDIKYHASAENRHALAALQAEILRTAARYVKENGVLIYSTCTISKEENEENVKRFLAEMPFAAEDMTPYLPKELENTSAKKGYLQLLPGKDPCDGFFIARMRRKSPA